MILKIISLFLIVMVALALMGRLKWGGRRNIGLKGAQKCPKCGNITFDSITCRCDSPSGKS